MISLKKYLDTVDLGGEVSRTEDEVLPAAIAAYRSALLEMGNCSLEACPGLGDCLKQSLEKLGDGLSASVTREAVEAAEAGVQTELQDWGRRTARHYRQKT